MAAEILLFNKYSTTGIKVQDPGLKDYISLAPVIVPKTGARYAGNRFHKSKISIVERLINKLMIPGHRAKKHKFSSGHVTGQAQRAYQIVKEAFEIIEQKTEKNPVAVFVEAIENASPREEIINIEYGGARYPKPVECAPQRRVDIVLRQMSQAAYHRSVNSKKSPADTLAKEILAAYDAKNDSQAIQKKIDLERTADSSR
jgi:small subunit ribosomal protein S7